MSAKVDRQLYAFAAGAGIPFLTALLVTPLIARQLSDEGLRLAGAVIVAHALFGLFDMFRPILIRRLVHLERGVTLSSLLGRPVVMGVVIAGAVGLCIARLLPELGVEFALAAGLSMLAFLLSTPFWAQLDASGRTGFAYVLRTIALVLIYLQLASVPAIIGEEWIPWTLLVGNVAAGLMMAVSAWNLLDKAGETIVLPIREMLLTLGQNITKSFGDYADRVAMLSFAGPALAGQYNLLADLPAKSNMPSQIAASYFYPRICKDKGEVDRFVWVGVLLNAAIVSAAIAFWFFGKPLYLLYYGDRFEALFPLFCMLLSVAGTYTLSFFGQAYLRSMHLDRSLLLSFAIPALVGAAWLVFQPKTLVTVVSALLIFRACSFLITIVSIRAGGSAFWRFVPSYGYGLAASLFFLSRIA